MKSPFAKDFWSPDNLRDTWEYKSIAFIFRVTIFLTICMYVFLAAPSVPKWVQIELMRTQPIAAFDAALTKAIETDDFKPIAVWVRYRNAHEQPVISATLEKNIENIPAPFITAIGQNASLSDKEQAAFWHMLARYRLRFDTLRCGNDGLIEKMQALQLVALKLSKQETTILELENDSKRMTEMLEKVLDYDAKHPARNSPAYSCTIFEGLSDKPQNISPPETWATIRHTLRLSTESGIAELKKQSTAAGTPPKTEEPQIDKQP